MTQAQIYFDTFRAKRALEMGEDSPVRMEIVGVAMGMNRKTLAFRLQHPETFRGYELSEMFAFLNVTKDDRDKFIEEVLKGGNDI